MSPTLIPPVDAAAAVPSLRTLGTGATQALAGNTASLPPSGSAGGDLTGTYPNPTLAAAGGGAAGPTGSATVIPIVTVDAKGRVTALSSATAAPTNAAGGALDGNYPNPGLNATVAGAGLAETSDVLSVNVDGTTIAITTDTLGVKAAGIGATQLAQSQKIRDFKQLSVFGATVVAESIPRYMASNNGAVLTTGRLSGQSIPVLLGDVLTSAAFMSATTAMSAETHLFFAIVDSAYNVIRQSTDQLSAATWNANSALSLTCDSIPVTAGARSASSTVTLTIPTLSQSLSTLVAVSDSIVVSNANIAAYNGTFTVASVTSTQITYVSGGSATDSLAAPFPTVQLAAGKRTYTVPSDGYVYAIVMCAGTVPTLANFPGLAGTAAALPLAQFSGDTSLTGTCPSPVAHATGLANVLMAGLL